MSDEKTTPEPEFIPEGSVPIETVFRAPDFEVDVPDIETFRDLRKDDKEDDDKADDVQADQPAAEPVVAETPAQPAPATDAEPVPAAESE